MMEPQFEIFVDADMITITGPTIAYNNIRNMYTTGDGHGLQLGEFAEKRREEVSRHCAAIADAVYALNDLLEKP